MIVASHYAELPGLFNTLTYDGPKYNMKNQCENFGDCVRFLIDNHHNKQDPLKDLSKQIYKLILKKYLVVFVITMVMYLPIKKIKGLDNSF